MQFVQQWNFKCDQWDTLELEVRASICIAYVGGNTEGRYSMTISRLALSCNQASHSTNIWIIHHVRRWTVREWEIISFLVDADVAKASTVSSSELRLSANPVRMANWMLIMRSMCMRSSNDVNAQTFVRHFHPFNELTTGMFSCHQRGEDGCVWSFFFGMQM